MSVTRLNFIKISGGLGAGQVLSGLGLDFGPVVAYAAEIKKVDRLKKANQTTSICCYCSVGCGLLCSTDAQTGRIINIEGDPEHPVSEPPPRHGPMYMPSSGRGPTSPSCEA